MSNSDLIWFHSEYIIFWYVMINIPSGNLLHCYWKWWFIVDLPIDSMVIFHSYVAVYQRATNNKSQWVYFLVYLKMEYTPKFFMAIWRENPEKPLDLGVG